MFSVSANNVITITRGDSASTAIYINRGTKLDPERYVLTENDAVYVGIMEFNQSFEDAIVKYKLTSENLNQDNDVTWTIKSTDTEYLEPGKYFYQIKLVRNDGTENQLVDTIVSKTELFIQD